MKSFVLCSLLVACATNDPRPPTVEVIATEILAPTCGQVQCHSTTTNIKNYAFDTLAAAKDSLKRIPKTGHDSLQEVLKATGGSRMPPDSPLDDADITLINTWIANGEPGL